MTFTYSTHKKNLLLLVMAFFTSLFGIGQDSTIISTGEAVPVFELLDEKDELFRISDHIGTKNMVIYFYPKDDTPGCTKEACAFRDDIEVFHGLDAIVIGISADSPESHQEFKEKYDLPFTLLSDPENIARKKFGVKGNLFGMIPGRVTFIVDKKGIIRYIYDSQTDAVKHVEEAMRILEEMK